MSDFARESRFSVGPIMTSGRYIWLTFHSSIYFRTHSSENYSRENSRKTQGLVPNLKFRFFMTKLTIFLGKRSEPKESEQRTWLWANNLTIEACLPNRSKKLRFRLVKNHFKIGILPTDRQFTSADRCVDFFGGDPCVSWKIMQF